MIKIYLHKTNKKYYYCVYSEKITTAQIHANWRVFFSTHKDNNGIIYITEHKPSGSLGDSEVLQLMAEYADQYKDKIEISAIFGIYGIRNFFYKVFLAFSRQDINRKLFDSRAELESYFGISLDLDFYEIAAF
jgi:hypothetical protein